MYVSYEPNVSSNESEEMPYEDNESRKPEIEYRNVDMFTSKKFFAFNQSCYALMVSDISRRETVTIEQLKVASNGVFKYLKQWRYIKSQLLLGENDALVLKSNTHLRVPCIEQWIEIVANVHVNERSMHRVLQDTLAILKMSWSMDLRSFGLSIAYVKLTLMHVDARR